MKFVFQPGPVFTNILLVDEINRATPKTQSALLEAMAERNVSVDGVTPTAAEAVPRAGHAEPGRAGRHLPAARGPARPVPVQLKMGYPDADGERMVMRGNIEGPRGRRPRARDLHRGDPRDAGARHRGRAPDAVETYILEIVHATRDDNALSLGASPRASISLAKAARVMAAADGRLQVYPEDVKVLLRPVLAHRLMLTPDAILRGESVDDVLDRIINRVKTPLGVANAPGQGGFATGQAPAEPNRRRRRATAAS